MDRRQFLMWSCVCAPFVLMQRTDASPTTTLRMWGTTDQDPYVGVIDLTEWFSLPAEVTQLPWGKALKIASVQEEE